ncbi:MAG: hypothetical protein M3Z65_08110 [Chloroflexota bacterium]|nr:hypothetical protein [Chloroflexota bacterium]
MRFAPIALAVLALHVYGSVAAADPGDFGRVHRTTPRGSLEREPSGLVVGIPSGRAWGIESDLIPLDGGGRVTVVLAVEDPDVAEAFVRIAYYARSDARSRQLATRDSPFVRVGEERRIAVDLDPPAGAIAYRVRVLGRLVSGAVRSRIDAITVQPLAAAADRGRPRPSLTRLLTDLP